MKFTIGKAGPNTVGDHGGFEERDLRKAIRERDTEGIVARFLVVLTDAQGKQSLIDKLRDGDEGPVPFCERCKRWMVWARSGKDWICPNCTYRELKRLRSLLD